MQEQIEKIKVQYTATKFENNDGFCIYLYQNPETKEMYTCVGNNLPKYKNVTFEMMGQFKRNKKYGLNFNVQTYTEIVENNKKSIISFLASGIIKGIGKATAEKIYDKFGNESIDIIENHPERLVEVNGISKRKATLIKNAYKENRVLKNLIQFLIPFGITTKQAVQIHQKLKIMYPSEIKEKPYKICKIRGITVETADLIAKNTGFPMNSKERLLAHVRHVLTENEVNGNTGIEVNEFGRNLIRSLNTPEFYNTSNLCDITIQLIKERSLTCKKIMFGNKVKTIIFNPYTYQIETDVAKKCIELVNTKQNISEDYMQRMLKLCSDMHFQPDANQLEAAVETIRSSLTVITGGPGTGKTTIIKLIAKYLKEYEKKHLIFMAPSGRAARRIEETTKYKASTIHKALGLRPDTEILEEDKVTFEDCTIIVDELSMVDIFLFYELMESIQLGCRVILVGDVNQLPSVGPGNVIRDLIDSGAVPVVRLTKIHRQSEHSVISENAKKIVEGNHDIKTGNDFFIKNHMSPQQARDSMIEHYVHYAKKYGVEKIYCLCPCRENIAGVRDMNTEIQKRMNPDAGKLEFHANGYSYRIGDPVMHLKNDDEVSNGDIGYVDSIYHADEEIVMDVLYFGDTRITYTHENADEMTLAYVSTVHKAQGSESDIALLYLSRTIGKKLLNRNLLNTAITRGKKLEGLFLTNDDALNMAIDNDDSENRITSLKYQLMYQSGEFFVNVS